ncbi:replication-relaxation family protein [Sphaerisporangium sp. TRM90804]|uniref:replication-relaxation family protein n=1 Tax=Sphaerisporangium sp. TRM90804 TaxID=3031113 RepID=UPI00244CC0EC|nr:replication-relaxation family protein [Sphaerisporangium sp. TRM90804]MDH2426469.1 replication-relaxation family protein [Sphaerisporangium sp. TRM90804]
MRRPAWRSRRTRAARDKAQRSRYEVAIRYAIQADPPRSIERRDVETALAVRRNGNKGRAQAIASAFAVYSGHNRLERHRLVHPAFSLAARRLARGYLLSVPELAALAHLPLDAAVPGLRRAGANTVAPSPAVVHGGPYAKPLGSSDAGHDRPVALRVADSCHHVHVLGPNGNGKSTLLGQMILSDITAGRGTVVIEAKGDLVRDLLGLIPEDAADRVVLIDPDDPHPRPALNALGGRDIDMAVDNLVGIFHKIYADYWGPRTDDILRGCALTLARTNGTLADIPALLSDPLLRRRLTSKIDDPLLRGFWAWYDGLSEQAQAHVTGPIMNKLRAFLLRPFVRDILGSASSTFDLGDVLDGGILLVRLPKGVLGDDTARLLGSVILAQVWQAAARRAKIGRSRSHAALYIDEAHNFLTLPHALSDMLAEARAYRLSLTLAHQHLAQFPRELRQAVSSDARNKIYFALSPEDAREIERHFLPYLTAHDLANFDAFQAAARLVVRAAETPPFTLRTRPLPDADRERARLVRLAASRAHGRLVIPAAQTGRPEVATRRRQHQMTGPRFSAAILTSLAARLTPRDRDMLRAVWEQRVLTSHQLAKMFFDSDTAARKRLLVLHHAGVLERFRPLQPVGQGTAPFHYVLGAPGAAVLASEAGVDFADFGYRRDRTLSIAHNQRLAHTVGVNGFHADLCGFARRRSAARVLAWWPERRCTLMWGDTVRPDAYGRWTEDESVLDFFLEYDTGSEPLDRVVAKLADYVALAEKTTIVSPVLFWLHSERREANLRKRMADQITATSVPVATGFRPSPGGLGDDGPAGDAWLPIGASAPRLRLAALSTHWPGLGRRSHSDSAEGDR